MARQGVATRLQVPLEHLVIPTPPDGYCLYHCFTAWDLGSMWLQNRTAEGFCCDYKQDAIHQALARGLRRRLVRFLKQVGREEQAARLELAGPQGYPGGDELPYLAELLHYTIVEHDLMHPAQPSFVHVSHGMAPVVEIGYRTTAEGAPHWVLLRTQWPVPEKTCDSSSDSDSQSDTGQRQRAPSN
jgi:hypothetical protein